MADDSVAAAYLALRVWDRDVIGGGPSKRDLLARLEMETEPRRLVVCFVKVSQDDVELDHLSLHLWQQGPLPEDCTRLRPTAVGVPTRSTELDLVTGTPRSGILPPQVSSDKHLFRCDQ